MAVTGKNVLESRWTFLTNHGHVLIAIARDPGVRLRDIAERVGITERAAQGIVTDLVEARYIERTRIGRRNQYTVRDDLPFRHPLEHDHPIGVLTRILAPPEKKGRTRAR
jgi:hypothetical protein